MLNRRFLWRMLLCAGIYAAVGVVLDGTIFLLSHLPLRAVHLDGMILWLAGVERGMAWPRGVMRHLWPSEATPAMLNYVLPILNCLIWAVLLAGLQEIWRNLRK